jgi:hypothetical protein
MRSKDEFDIENLRLDGSLGSQDIDTRSRKPPRHRVGEKFLKGPVPWNWLLQAGRLKGKTLQLVLLLWFKVGIKNSSTITFNHSQAKVFNISEDSTRRAMKELLKAGLISVRYFPGRCIEVTLLDAPEE